ncbi:hypothetical protein RKD18_006658 [Streptomyces phaeoluteigriseus]
MWRTRSPGSGLGLRAPDEAAHPVPVPAPDGEQQRHAADHCAAIEATPGLQGGFIWEFWGHGILQRVTDGRPAGRGGAGLYDSGVAAPGYRWAHGGDFGERDHDGAFTADGVVFPDRTSEPVLYAHREPTAPVRLECFRHEGLVLSNRQQYRGLEWLAARWELSFSDGGTPPSSGRGNPPLPTLTAPAVLPRLRPGETAVVPLPFELPPDGGEVWLTLRVTTAEDLPWTPRGTEVCTPQLRLRAAEGTSSEPVAGPLVGPVAYPLVEPVAEPLVEPVTVPLVEPVTVPLVEPVTVPLVEPVTVPLVEPVTGPLVEPVAGPPPESAAESVAAPCAESVVRPLARRTVAAGVDVDADGLLVHPLLTRAPTLSLCRAPTGDAELGGTARRRRTWGPGALVRRLVSVRRDGESVTVVAEYAGTTEVVRHRQVFTPAAGGGLRIHEEAELPDAFDDVARVGSVFETVAGFDLLEWCGQGPWESYADRGAGAPVGPHSLPVGALFTPGPRPRESGGRHGVRRFTLSAPDGTGLTVTLDEPRQVSVTRHRAENRAAAAHHDEVVPRTGCVVHLDAAHRGLGTASRGPDTFPAGLVAPGRHRWSWTLRVV